MCALPKCCSPAALVAGQNSLQFGFHGGPESANECRTRSGEIRYSPSRLDRVLRGRLAIEAEVEASEPRYDGMTTFAVTSITVLSDGIGNAKEGITDEIRPLHSSARRREDECNRECLLKNPLF